MNALDLIQALIMLGAPMVALSWFLFSWLFATGEIDRGDNNKALSARLKKLEKTVSMKESKNTNYVYDKWMWFGSGFYGLAGLWTFAVIEIQQFFGFVINISTATEVFSEGLLAGLIEIGVGQLGNVLEAFLWFSYWPADSILVWVMVAYLGYWTGVELARRSILLPDSVKQWLDNYPVDKLRGSWLKRFRSGRD